jgi:hypothetical protein
MSIYRPTPRPANRGVATMLPLKPTSAPTPQPQPTPTPAVEVAYPPSGVSLAQASGGGLIVTWTAPATDNTHSAATGFNLQFSPSGAAAWTLVPGVSSPYTLSGLASGAAFDIQLQSSNSAGTSGWTSTSTLSTITAIPNSPSHVSLAQGNGSDLMVTWAASAIDTMHGAATVYNLRSSPSGAGTWTIVSDVTSPYDLSGLASDAAIDVQMQSLNAAGTSAWSATSTLTTGNAVANAPNAPVITSVSPPPDGTTSKLIVSWTAPATDSTHGAATGYNLRSSPAGAGTWTTVTGVTSPYTLTGLAGATSIDVEVQATNAAAIPGAWSATSTGTSWGATVAPGPWTAAASQTHNTTVAPNGGINFTATPAPTAVTGGAFCWSTSPSTLPTIGLIAATTDGQTNGWGQWFNTPTTAGTFYLWMMAQGAGGVTTGALVTSAIVVS